MKPTAARDFAIKHWRPYVLRGDWEHWLNNGSSSGPPRGDEPGYCIENMLGWWPRDPHRPYDPDNPPKHLIIRKGDCAVCVYDSTESVCGRFKVADLAAEIKSGLTQKSLLDM